jgi:hypothetical protein
MIHSLFKYFAKVRSTEIGLKLSFSNLEHFLKIRVILAYFNLSEKLTLVKESFTKNSNGSNYI